MDTYMMSTSTSRACLSGNACTASDNHHREAVVVSLLGLIESTSDNT